MSHLLTSTAGETQINIAVMVASNSKWKKLDNKLKFTSHVRCQKSQQETKHFWKNCMFLRI